MNKPLQMQASEQINVEIVCDNVKETLQVPKSVLESNISKLRSKIEHCLCKHPRIDEKFDDDELEWKLYNGEDSDIEIETIDEFNEFHSERIDDGCDTTIVKVKFERQSPDPSLQHDYDDLVLQSEKNDSNDSYNNNIMFIITFDNEIRTFEISMKTLKLNFSILFDQIMTLFCNNTKFCMHLANDDKMFMIVDGYKNNYKIESFDDIQSLSRVDHDHDVLIVNVEFEQQHVQQDQLQGQEEQKQEHKQEMIVLSEEKKMNDDKKNGYEQRDDKEMHTYSVSKHLYEQV